MFGKSLGLLYWLIAFSMVIPLNFNATLWPSLFMCPCLDPLHHDRFPTRSSHPSELPNPLFRHSPSTVESVDRHCLFQMDPIVFCWNIAVNKEGTSDSQAVALCAVRVAELPLRHAGWTTVPAFPKSEQQRNCVTDDANPVWKIWYQPPLRRLRL